MLKLERWHPSPEFEAEFIAAIPKLGAAADFSSWAVNYTRGHGGRCYWDAQFVSKMNPKRCLNIGGAPYIFEFALKKCRPQIEIVTIDLDPDRFPNAGVVAGTAVVKADIERESPSIGLFDVVVFTEVFEHLRIDVLQTIGRLRDFLNEGGRLFLSMPNGLGFNAIRKHLLRGRTGPSPVEEWSKLGRLGHMGHVREYSVIEISEVLKYCGFTIETAFYRTQHIAWPTRNLLLKMRPALGDEVLIVAKKSE